MSVSTTFRSKTLPPMAVLLSLFTFKDWHARHTSKWWIAERIAPLFWANHGLCNINANWTLPKVVSYSLLHIRQSIYQWGIIHLAIHHNLNQSQQSNQLNLYTKNQTACHRQKLYISQTHPNNHKYIRIQRRVKSIAQRYINGGCQKPYCKHRDSTKETHLYGCQSKGKNRYTNPNNKHNNLFKRARLNHIRKVLVL